MIFLMISSTTLSLIATEPAEDDSATSYSIFSDGELLTPETVTQGGDVSGQGTLVDYNQLPPQPHPALFDIMWTDPGVSSGVINDMSAILALSESYSLFLEESNKEDHDNDGINDLMVAMGQTLWTMTMMAFQMLMIGMMTMMVS